MQTPQSNFQNNNAEIADGIHIGALLRFMLPFWPVALVAILLGYGISEVYLRTQTPVYEINADILLKDESMSGCNCYQFGAIRKGGE